MLTRIRTLIFPLLNRSRTFNAIRGINSVRTTSSCISSYNNTKTALFLTSSIKSGGKACSNRNRASSSSGRNNNNNTSFNIRSSGFIRLTSCIPAVLKSLSGQKPVSISRLFPSLTGFSSSSPANFDQLGFQSSRQYKSSQGISRKSGRISEMAEKKRVCIIGSGNWGSAISKVIGFNTIKYADVFEPIVKMYVFEEIHDNRKLTEWINVHHENAKYLPGHKLPENIVAVPDVLETAKDADILIFVLPHQFIKKTCAPLVGKMRPGAFGLSLIKGFDVAPEGGIELISHIITRFLDIPCNVLMGANLAPEIAAEKFSETTIGVLDVEQGKILHKLIQTDYFRVVVVDDKDTVEMCGALKNIVACAAGFIDGLGMGDNTKAAVIRLGLMEMVRFAQEFYAHSAQLATFLESCGVADLITTCYGGRNRKVSEAFVKTGKSMTELEAEMLNGQRLQGPMTAHEVNTMLKIKGLEEKYPLFTAVHRICVGEIAAPALIDCIRNHPEHLSGEFIVTFQDPK
ncbi:glycerol-3-phosphate dehydrogenase [NAD(+)], cytoplasmic isoform X2 [Folsomia candida]|uniref:glycerol-3-phosphate dehydrogenase [NAD(+)], cytoplasmic isoform X2 n=1 Tax=Folsomia candida TaxID=158441 RepID=UPI000B8F3A6D|nr:glycerol-3-phosphate dehydrogenase [NAD(+)], cytoplasmic isoform X2 [Folsomia candida]